MMTPLCMVPVQEDTTPSQTASKQSRAVSKVNLILIFRQLSFCAVVLLLAFGSYLLINQHVLGSVRIAGKSMTPTLQENGHYLVNWWKLKDYALKSGDIVVIKDPANQGLSVQRIIAVEGQSVHFKEGRVFVDGKELQEPYLAPGTPTYTYSQKHEQFILCGKNQFFVLGDNRQASIDSRSYGPISKENIQGLLLVR